MTTDLEQRPTVIDGEIVATQPTPPMAARPNPAVPGAFERIVMRLIALLFLVFAVYAAWCAATGYHL